VVLPEFCMPGDTWPAEPGGLSPVAVPVVVFAVGLEMDGVPVPTVFVRLSGGGIVRPGDVTPGEVGRADVASGGMVVPVLVCA
jgi:hypothetical protein